MQRTLLFVPLAALLLAAGCDGGVARHLTTDTALRQQVLGAIAANPNLAAEALERIMAVDSTRTRVLEGMLRNDAFAQQLLTRVATTPGAVDMVIGMAARDSLMRDHVITLVKGMAMAQPGGTPARVY